MALSGNKLLGLLEDSGYKVQTVKTNKSTNNSNNSSTNNTPARGAANRGGSNSGTTSTTVKTDSSEKKENNSSSKSDIAPVRTTTSSTSSKDEENKWFQKGAFEDGYQFGDVLRTILGTAGDVGVGLVKGATSLVGGLADAATVGIAKVADAFGDEELARNMRNAQSSATTIDNAFAPIDNYLDRYSVLGEKSDNIAEGIGQVGSVILTGGIAGALGATAAGATALTTGLLGASSFGSGMREALNSGANEKEAATYGLIKGVVDAGSEMIFGGLGKTVKALGISRGLSSLDDMFAKQLSSKITNQVAKNFVQFGVKASAEGVEEVLAGFGSAVGKKLTYMSDEDLKTLVKDENLLEQFVAGAVTSGFAQSGFVPGMRAGSLAEANKSRTDFVTGHSVNEQKVIDKEVENRIAEAEKDGKVTNKQKNEIYEEVIRDMERGYISTDTIEEVLGGETYKTHSDTIAREKALQDEYDKLYKMKNGEKSDEQIDRQADLKKQLEDIEKNFNRNQLRDEVMSLVQNDRLSESYYERSRRGQNFTADVSKYDAKQQETIQKAIDSGILNNTNRTHEFVDMIAKITADKGVSFDFTNNQKLKESVFAVEGASVNGYVTKDGVTINIQSSKSLNSVVGHEITHVLEGTELYDVLSETITEYAKTKGDYDKRLVALTELYKNVEDTDVNAELVADLVGDYLFTDADFVRNLSATNKNVFQKIFDEIKYLCKVATAGSKEARQLEKVKKAFEDAYKTDSKTQTETKYSLSETSDGRFVAVVDNDILSNIDTSSWDDTKKAAAKKAAVDALKQFSNGIVVDGVTRKVNRTSRREYTRSNYTESLYNKAPDFFADKMRAADIADDIVVAATDWSRDGGLKHPRTDDFVDFDHGNTLILSGDAKYSAEVIVGITKTGEAVLYDVVDLKPADFDVKKEEVPTTATTQNAIGDIQGTSLKVGQSGKSDTSLLDDNIAPSKPGVNPKAGNNTQSGTFSLSQESDQFAPIGNYNVYGSDVALDDAPVPEYGDVLANEARKNAGDDFAPVRGGTQGTGRQRPRNPILDKKTSKIWSKAKDMLFDRGTVFETLSKQTGNREVDAKYRSMGRAQASAQYFMEHGNTNTKSLDSIRKTVEKSGKYDNFQKYLYHLHNVDRVNANKPLYGHYTAEQSQAIADKLAKDNPEFLQWADDVYSYNSELLEKQVECGLITPEFRSYLHDKYPNYVPVIRVGKDGQIVSEIDDMNLSVNHPIKQATGGSGEMLPLFETMALRTQQTFKAVAQNNFGVELKNTLGSVVGSTGMSFDEAFEGIYGNQLQQNMPGTLPTMTVYENGEKVTFEINQEMYDTLQPVSKAMSYDFKPFSAASNLKRSLITEYNPVFTGRNAIKDAQDVLFNSQHAVKTYANFPRAAAELLNKSGQYYQEYMENGGESVTYFNNKTNTFAEDKNIVEKTLGWLPGKISEINNFIERVPRLAEYIASREMGRSIDESMLDAARVTTDFSAGGDLTKFLNRNGFTFLNSNVQGTLQNVRNIREAAHEGVKGWAKLATKIMVAGLPEMILNNLIWDDDEDYEDLSDYVKQKYYVIAKYGDGKFVRIPKGRVAIVISNAFTQMQNMITGDDEFDFDTFATLVKENLLVDDVAGKNIFAPLNQAIANKTWYGDEIVPERMQDLPVSEQFDENTDSLSRWLSAKAEELGFEISPLKINYMLESSTGILGDYFLPMMTPAAERGNDSLLGNLIAPFADEFTTDSVLKNQKVNDFYDMKGELAALAEGGGSAEDTLSSRYANSISSQMYALYEKKREIQNSDLSDSEKYQAVREIQKQINALAKKGLANSEDVSVSGKYGEVGDKRYNFDAEEDVWYEIRPKKSDGDDNWYYQQEQIAMKRFGVSPEDFWNNREFYTGANNYFDSEYNDPNVDLKAIAENVFGMEEFAEYASNIGSLKGDDLDGDGKADKNTKKRKVLAYIDSLEISDVEKDILKKMSYPYEKTDNRAIAEYLNSREDLSYDDRVNVLSNLGFKVADDGRITNFGPGSSYGGGGGGTSYNSGRQQKAIERYGITAAEYQANPDLYKNADYYFDSKYLDDDLDLEFVAKTVFGLDEFVQYAAELSQIRGDDLDGDGKSDSGTKKKKIFAYIDSLDIPDIEKEILRKMSYRYEKRSNTRIINYLKNREDISDDDRLKVLRGLGFKVFDDGRISW